MGALTGKKKSTKLVLPANKIVRMLVLIITVGVLCTSGIINQSLAADPQPGETAYYEAIWESAKEKVNWVSSGVSNPGPWKLDTGKTPWVQGAYTEPIARYYITNKAGAPVQVRGVSTAAELYWCMVNRVSFRLLNDIDLGGQNGTNFLLSNANGNTNELTIDGNGYTVYNLNMRSTGYLGFFVNLNNANSIIKNFHIKNAYIDGADSAGIFGRSLTGYTITGCSVEDSMVRVSQRLSSGFVDTATNLTVTNSYTKNVHTYSPGNIAGGGGSACTANFVSRMYGSSSITNCFAVDGTSIANGSHAGGFMSCNGITGGSTGSVTVQNCFTNVDVYGRYETGTFAGVTHGGTHSFTNCYSSGKIEGIGQLGGFLATTDVTGSGASTVTFNQCYSTTLVGLTSEATDQGGFIGAHRRVSTNVNTTIKVKDAYAAGEVGSLSTNTDPVSTRPSNSRTVAGFTGDQSAVMNYMTYENCYYDKQTTAMREWALGSSSAGGWTSDQLQSGSYPNQDVMGVLTTDTAKSGTGLTSNPTTSTYSTGFAGFSNNGQWVYKEGLYPQLAVFANATTTVWGKQATANLVKAYSQASASTVYLETWEKDYQGNDLGSRVYDTVRDLTLKFNLTSSSNTNWEADGTKATLYGSESDIFELDKNDEDVWYADHFVPGTEWVTVTCDVGGQSGNRRLRIIPTSNIRAGDGTAFSATQFYDHADDVRFAYSTGARTAVNPDDITLGIFPDNTLTDEQRAIQGIANNGSGRPPNFPANWNKYTGVNMDHMSQGAGLDNAYGSEVEVDISYIKVIDSANGEVSDTEPVDLTNVVTAEKWNGQRVFENEDEGYYLITYYWNLGDKRYLRDSKIITVKTYPYYTQIEVQNTNGTRNSDQLYLDVYSLEPSSPGYSMGSATAGLIKEDEIAGGSPTGTAWKKKFAATNIQSIQVKMGSDNLGWYYSEQVPATVGRELKIPVVRYRSSVDSDNRVHVTVDTIEKTYRIQQAADGTFYLEFNKAQTDDKSGIYYQDVEENIEIKLVVAALPTPGLSIATAGAGQYTGTDGETAVRGKVAVNAAPTTGLYDQKTVSYGGQHYVRWQPDDASYVVQSLSVKRGTNPLQELYLSEESGKEEYVYTNAECTDRFQVRSDIGIGYGFVEVKRNGGQLIFPEVTEDIHVNVSFKINRTDFIISKTLEDPAEEEEKFVFKIDYYGNGAAAGSLEQTMYAVLTLKPGETKAEAKFADMDFGWYTVTEVDANWRFDLDQGQLSGDRVDTGAGSITYYVDDTRNIEYKFTNKRLDVPWANGKDSITNQMPDDF